MTAIASPRERSPLRLPSPPQKPMPAGHRKGRRGSCLGLSCFGGSPVGYSDTGHPVARGRRASWFTWSRFRKKKKTVPVDSSATELIPEKIVPGDDRRPQTAGEDEAAGKGGHGAEGEEPGKQHRQRMPPSKTPPRPPPAAVELPSQSFFWRLRKGNKDGGESKMQLPGFRKDRVSASNRKQQQQQRRPPQQQTRLPSISPKYDSRHGAPALFQSEPARTARRAAPTPAAGCSPSPSSPTASPAPARPPPNHAAGTTYRLGGTKSHKKCEQPSSSSSSLLVGKNDQVLGLSVMAVVLVMMVLFGRASAIVFTCLWFFCIPRLRATMTETNRGGGKSSAGIDFDSEEYKKRVVLEGLLRRNGRKPAG